MRLPRNVLSAFEGLSRLNVTLSDILLSLLLSKPEELDRLALDAIDNLVSNQFAILDAFRTHSTFARGTQNWIHHYASEDIIAEVKRLTHISTGWHGNARNSRIEDFETLNAESIASTAKNVAPMTWAFFDRILIKSDASEAEDDRMINEDQMIDEDACGTGESDLSTGIDQVAKLRELVRIIIFQYASISNL